jgi:hypothetical protein
LRKQHSLDIRRVIAKALTTPRSDAEEGYVERLNNGLLEAMHRKVVVFYVNFALDSDSGVKPGEISENHYSSRVLIPVGRTQWRPFASKRICGAQDRYQTASCRLTSTSPHLLSLWNPGARQFGTVAPGVVQFTTDVLFRDVCLRTSHRGTGAS